MIAGTKADVTGTAAAITGTATPCYRAIIQNDPNSTIHVLVGNSSAQTYQLSPGASVELFVRDLTEVYVKLVSAGTETVNWLAWN